jgi:transcriptional regulator with XRE-family HTH domain
MEAKALNKRMGTRLRRLRQALELEPKVAAANLRIGYHALNKYELGQRVPDLDDMLRLADYYTVSLDYLIAGRHDEKPIRHDAQELRIAAGT